DLTCGVIDGGPIQHGRGTGVPQDLDGRLRDLFRRGFGHLGDALLDGVALRLAAFDGTVLGGVVGGIGKSRAVALLALRDFPLLDGCAEVGDITGRLTGLGGGVTVRDTDPPGQPGNGDEAEQEPQSRTENTVVAGSAAGLRRPHPAPAHHGRPLAVHTAGRTRTAVPPGSSAGAGPRTRVESVGGGTNTAELFATVASQWVTGHGVRRVSREVLGPPIGQFTARKRETVRVSSS